VAPHVSVLRAAIQRHIVTLPALHRRGLRHQQLPLAARASGLQRASSHVSGYGRPMPEHAHHRRVPVQG
jgi:hypothetical protein